MHARNVSLFFLRTETGTKEKQQRKLDRLQITDLSIGIETQHAIAGMEDREIYTLSIAVMYT